MARKAKYGKNKSFKSLKKRLAKHKNRVKDPGALTAHIIRKRKARKKK
jgi:hypothetical protein